MYVLVKLLKGFSKPLFYKIPTKLNILENNTDSLIGKLVKVPLKNKYLPALVLKIYPNLPSKIEFKVKEIFALEDFPRDDLYQSFIEKISKFYFVESLHFYQRIRNFFLKTNKCNIQDFNIEQSAAKKIKLTQDQQEIVTLIKPFIEKQKYFPTLLHGVTGSGKTEIYKELIIECFKQNKFAVLLLPEISLSIQFEHLLKKQLPRDIKIIGFHSATKNIERKELWQRLLENKPTLIIGVHLPILLPIPNLGLIIIDEEHETGFQEKKHPKINSKELSIWKAKFYNIPILLGSATPSLNSLYNVKKNNWNFVQLKTRFSGQFPKIKLVLLNDKTGKRRKSFWITKELEDAITNTLEKKEQIIIYLNRRGYSFFVQCKKCGFIFQCPNCSVSLTLHSKDQNSKILCCHYCNYKKNLPTTCPDCKAGERDFLQKGVGTQQIVTILQKMFPKAIIQRADLDSTSKKRAWQETVEKFEKGKIDILVGTQLITKGYHFPNVSLVGILWADLNLHFPIFNASETTIQQLIQVAGRAGRQHIDSLVIVQTMQNHSIFNHINEQDYLIFCEKELSFRKITNYPPFFRLVQIELKNVNPQELENESFKLYDQLNKINEEQNLNIQILGPAKPIVYRIQKTESRQIYLKTESFKKVDFLIKKSTFSSFKSKIFIILTP